MNFLEKENKKILILKIKMPFVILCIGLSCNAQVNSKDFYGYYFSNQSTDFDKIILYHFSYDSLKVFNSNTRQYLKFSAKYSSDAIFLTNDQINDHKLNLKFNNNEINNITDNDSIISFDEENKLFKFEIDKKMNIQDIADKYWELNFDNYKRLILYFNLNTKRTDNYHDYNDSNTIICDPSIRPYFKFEDVYVIDYIMSGELYVITNIDNNTITLKTLLPSNKIKTFELLEHKNEVRKANIQGKWQRVESTNPHYLPKELYITSNKINIDDKEVNYRIGLDEKYIIYKKDKRENCITIDSLNNQKLKLTLPQSPLGKETSLYKKIR